MLYAPRALRHFGFAAMEARADRTGRAIRPAPRNVTPRRPIEVHPAPQRTVVRLWLPLTPLFLLLAPFAMLLAPLLYFVPPPYNARPLAMVAGVGQMLLSLSGTVVDIDTRDALVRIRIF
ncbi:MAG TPA: hypothetical protein VGH86_17915 [Phenylobacterium sp.]|jgi:hypothetical protein